MLSWIKNLIARREDPQTLAKTLDKTLEFKSLTKGVDAYLETRRGQISGAYLPVLQARLPTLLAGATDGPELIAQSEWLRYVGEMTAVEERLREEIPKHWPELVASADLVDLKPELRQYLNEAVATTVRRLTVEGALVVVRELEAARSARGLSPLNLPSEGDLGSLAALQSAYVLVRVVTGHMRQAVQDHMERRMVPLQERYLDAFRQLLRRVRESPPQLPAELAEAVPENERAALHAEIQGGIFVDKVNELPGKLREELHNQLADWFTLADLGGLRPMLDAKIDARIAELVKALNSEGESMLQAAVRSGRNSPLG